MNPSGFKALFRLSVLAMGAIGSVGLLYHTMPLDYAFAFRLGSDELSAGYQIRLFLFPIEVGLIGVLSLGLALAAAPLGRTDAEELPAAIGLLLDRHRSMILGMLLACLSLHALHALLAAQTYLAHPAEGLFLELPRWRDFSDGLVISVLGMVACRLGTDLRVRGGERSTWPWDPPATLRSCSVVPRVIARVLFLGAALYPLVRIPGWGGDVHQEKLCIFLVPVELLLASWVAEATGAAMLRGEFEEARRIARGGVGILVPMEFCRLLLRRWAWPSMWTHPDSNSPAYDQFLFPHGRHVNVASLTLGAAFLATMVVVFVRMRSGGSKA